MRWKNQNGSSGCSRLEAFREINWPWAKGVFPNQVHGNRVCVGEAKHQGRGMRDQKTALARTDSLITKILRMPLTVLTADCLPLFILDPKKRAIGLVHAGLRGVAQNIVLNTLAKMSNCFGTKTCDCLVVLGPCLRDCCYEVKKEFRAIFPKHTLKRKTKLYFDLATCVVGQLEGLGVNRDHIFDSQLCTACRQEEFFSYRKEGDQAGRSMSAFELCAHG